MSINSSSFSYYCSNSKVHFISAGMIALKAVLALLLCTYILYLGYQRCQQHHSKKTVTHSELFTYHLAAMELFWFPGFLLYGFGHYRNNGTIIIVSYSFFSFTFFAEVLFHFLTCVEWYLAVVHPITYLSLRNSRGVSIRNVTIGSVWLISFGFLIFYIIEKGENMFFAVLSFLAVSVVVISFCSISVLCVLIRPQIGKNGVKKRVINQSKLRAFHTVTAISCVLWLGFGGLFVSYSLTVSPLLSEIVECLIMAGINWLNLPTFLVSPLLYLHGAGKLFCNCNKSKWG